MLQFTRKDGEYITTIESHGFDSFRYNDINRVTIEGNPEPYLNMLCSVYMDGRLIGSGVVGGYSHRKNENTAELSIYPRTLDLNADFIAPESKNTDIANVLESILDQYMASVDHPVLYLKEKNLTGTIFKYDWDGTKTLKEAWDFVCNKFVGTSASVIVEADGGVVIRNTGVSHNMTYMNDILRIEYEKDTAELVNFIRFTNGRDPEDESYIYEEYEDSDSIAAYGKRVMYISDERFVHIESVDEYCNNILSSRAYPKVTVQEINTLRDTIHVGDTVTISNWEKNFADNLPVNRVTYNANGTYTLDIGMKESREEMLEV